MYFKYFLFTSVSSLCIFFFLVVFQKEDLRLLLLSH